MPVAAINATSGSASANSYITLAEADQYNFNRPNTAAWTATSDPEKTAAILWATLLMDSLWIWNGYPVDAVQALQWPRGAILKRNGWEYVPLAGAGSIPQELKNATAEYARQLLASDRTADSQIETMGITSLGAGPVRLTFKDSVYAKQVPDAVFNLIPHGGNSEYMLGASDWGYLRGQSTGVRMTSRT